MSLRRDDADLTLALRCGSFTPCIGCDAARPTHWIPPDQPLSPPLNTRTLCAVGGAFQQVVVDGEVKPCLDATTVRARVTCRECLSWMHA